jgi:hypothetical protein
VEWTPLVGPEGADWDKPDPDSEDESKSMGKPWSYRLEIKSAADLPMFCNMAYVEYEFFGEGFVKQAVQDLAGTYSPAFNHAKIYHVNEVTEECMAFLKGPMECIVHTTQHVAAPIDKIGTGNEIVLKSVKTGEAKGYEHSTATKPKSEAEVRAEKLASQLEEIQSENEKLMTRVAELELKAKHLENSDPRKPASH